MSEMQKKEETAMASQKKPNLVFIVPDEFRAQAMGFRREDPVITPNMDALAGESLAFHRA